MSNWLSVDPIALYDPVNEVEHYIDGQHNGGYYNPRNTSVYGYCYQNPIKYVDPNGKQTDVILFESKSKEATLISGSKATESQPNSFQVSAHGNANYIRNVENGQRSNAITESKSFNSAFGKNKEWNSNKNKEGFAVILYSCNTGNDEGVKNKKSVARKISKGNPVLRIIAPTKQVWSSRNGLVGTYGNGDNDEIDYNNPGTWNVYENGVIVEKYDHDWTPKAEPTLWDRIYYKQNINEEQK